MAGLPLDAWALLVVSVWLGLGLEVAFVRARRRDERGRGVSGGGHEVPTGGHGSSADGHGASDEPRSSE